MPSVHPYLAGLRSPFGLLAATALTVVTVALPADAADGIQGSTSTASASISLQITRSAQFIITSTGAPLPDTAASMAQRRTRAPAMASGNGNQVGVKAFYVEDRTTQEWFAEQIAANGEAEFSMCLPDGVDGQAIGVLDTDTGLADYISAVDSSDYSLMVSVTPPTPSASGDASAGCASGVSSRIQISMTQATAAGGNQSQGKDISSKKPEGDYTKVNLIMVPE